MKIGDKVRVIECFDNQDLVGRIGVVADIDGSGDIGVRFNNFRGHTLFGKIKQSDGWYIDENHLTPASSPKACKSAKRYLGKRPPKCNRNHPCDTCIKIYLSLHKEPE